MSLDLLKIFEGFVRNYHTLNLTRHHGRHSLTMTEINYFARLGSMLGYWTFTEDTINGEYRPMDLSWWDEADSEGWNRLVLHLERENSWTKDEETLEKLFSSNRETVPDYAIGILAVNSVERMDQLANMASSMCKIPNSLLIFRIEDEPVMELRPFLFENGKFELKRIARIKFSHGVYTMYFENEEDKEKTINS